MERIRIVKMDATAITPTRGHSYDAGLDLYCSENTPYKPGEIIKVSTKIAIEVPPGYVGLVRDRSSISLTRLKVTAGIIDTGYTGELCVVLLNLSGEHGCIKAGQKIAQLLIVPVMLPEVEVVDKLDALGGRADKGWGSSDRECLAY